MTSCTSDAQIQVRSCSKEVQETVRCPVDVSVIVGLDAGHLMAVSTTHAANTQWSR